MTDYETTKNKYSAIKKRIDDEVGEISGIEFLILMLVLFQDSSVDLLNDEELTESQPDNVKKACRIILEELRKEHD